MKDKVLLLKNGILLGVILLMVGACNDDEENVASKADLVGNWTTQSVDLEVTINGEDFMPYLMEALGVPESQAQAFADQLINELENNFDGTVNLKEDNTYVSTFGNETDDGTWSLNADGNKLILDEGTTDETIADIIELSSNTLRLSFSETEETEDMDGDDVGEEMKMTIEMTLTK